MPAESPLNLKAVVVLAGGGGTRLGGISKADLLLGRQRLLEWAYQSVADLPRHIPLILMAPQTVKVPVPLPRKTIQLMENPPGSGPAIAFISALEYAFNTTLFSSSPNDWIGLIPVDAPNSGRCLLLLQQFATQLIIKGEVPQAVIAQAAGYRQPVIGIFHAESALEAGRKMQSSASTRRSMKALLNYLDVASLPVANELVADLDTPEDLIWWENSLLSLAKNHNS